MDDKELIALTRAIALAVKKNGPMPASRQTYVNRCVEGHIPGAVYSETKRTWLVPASAVDKLHGASVRRFASDRAERVVA